MLWEKVFVSQWWSTSLLLCDFLFSDVIVFRTWVENIVELEDNPRQVQGHMLNMFSYVCVPLDNTFVL